MLAAPCVAATSVATVGDSFADAIYTAMRARPEILKANDIQLVRWSRPAVGLARSDFFDYAAWLRESGDLGIADFCVVQVGANDLQSIPAGPGKWVLFPTGQWKDAYSGRVHGIVETLRTRHCRSLIWVLQPGYPNSKALSRYHQMINELQVAGVGPDAALVFDVDASESDYGRDGIHFNGPFTLRLGDAIFRAIASWKELAPATCFGCHSRIRMEPRLPAVALLPLRARPESGISASLIAAASDASPQSFTPPRLKPPGRVRLVAVRREGTLRLRLRKLKHAPPNC